MAGLANGKEYRGCPWTLSPPGDTVDFDGRFARTDLGTDARRVFDEKLKAETIQ